MSGFKDSCKQLNGISANLGMNMAPVSRKPRRVAATGAISWQSGGDVKAEHLPSFQTPSNFQLARHKSLPQRLQ